AARARERVERADRGVTATAGPPLTSAGRHLHAGAGDAERVRHGRGPLGRDCRNVCEWCHNRVGCEVGSGESLGRALAALADPLHEPVLLAFPFFIAFVAIEWVSARVLEAREPGGYHPRDAVTSLVMGASSQLFWLAGKLIGL